MFAKGRILPAACLPACLSSRLPIVIRASGLRRGRREGANKYAARTGRRKSRGSYSGGCVCVTWPRSRGRKGASPPSFAVGSCQRQSKRFSKEETCVLCSCLCSEWLCFCFGTKTWVWEGSGSGLCGGAGAILLAFNATAVLGTSLMTTRGVWALVACDAKSVDREKHHPRIESRLQVSRCNIALGLLWRRQGGLFSQI